MVSPNALTGQGRVVLQKRQPIEPFKRWASAAKTGAARIFIQLNHPGRQVYKSMSEQGLAPSAIGVNIPGFSKSFPKPKALEDNEITAIIQRFTNSAVLAEQAGFDGCQIHAAHGYLISQFLSPLTNLRNDQWGGSLENRARLLFDVIKSVRVNVKPGFCVSVKLNSADFQKGGFEQKDAQRVIEQLNAMSVDLVELSGGCYESPAMQGNASNDSTGERDAYFIEFAQELAEYAQMPIMVTGGIRKLSVAKSALNNKSGAINSVAMFGIGRAFAFNPDLANDWRQDQSVDISLPQLTWKNKTLAALGVMAITKEQLNRLANNKKSKLSINPVWAIIKDRLKTRLRTRRYRRWRERHDNTS